MLVYRSPRCTTKVVVENVRKIGIFLCVRDGKTFPPKKDEKSSGFNYIQKKKRIIRFDTMAFWNLVSKVTWVSGKCNRKALCFAMNFLVH